MWYTVKNWSSWASSFARTHSSSWEQSYLPSRSICGKVHGSISTFYGRNCWRHVLIYILSSCITTENGLAYSFNLMPDVHLVIEALSFFTPWFICHIILEFDNFVNKYYMFKEIMLKKCVMYSQSLTPCFHISLSSIKFLLNTCDQCQRTLSTLCIS